MASGRSVVKPVRVAVIGCGLIGRRRAEIVHRSVTDELVIVADVDESRAEAVGDEMGCFATSNWQEVVERDDVDIVVVSTSNDWLTPISVAALQCGKHVLVEKPAARSPKEALSILQAAGRSIQTAATAHAQDTTHCGPDSRPTVRIGFNHRHHPAVWKAHELFAQGVIGDVLFVRCRYGHGGRPGYDKEWRADPQIAGGGELLDQGIHAVDLFRWFLGDFAEAFGFTGTSYWKLGCFPAGRNEHPLLAGSRAEDNAFALFRTSTGQTASLHASWTQWKNLFSYEVFGQDGYLTVEGLGGSYGPERLIWGCRRPESGPPDEQVFDFPGPDISWAAEWQEFVTAIREGREPLTNANDGLQAIRMVYAVYESSRTGQVVRL